MFSRRLRTIILAALLAAPPLAARDDSISAPDLSARLGGGEAPLVLDVRSKHEYQDGHVPGALHIPYRQLPNRLSELSGDKRDEIVVYCEVGGRAAVATDILEQAGFERIRTLEGHMKQWRAGGFPLE